MGHLGDEPPKHSEAHCANMALAPHVCTSWGSAMPIACWAHVAWMICMCNLLLFVRVIVLMYTSILNCH